MPATVAAEDFFDWDLSMMCIDASMRRPQRVIQSDDSFVTFEDRAGYTARKFVGKSRPLEWIDHVTKDRTAWNALRRGFDLDPDGAARIDEQSYFGHMSDYPSWQEAKRQYDSLRAGGKYLVFNVYGPWEGTWRHRGYTRLLTDLAEAPAWVAEMAEVQSDSVLACLQHCIALGMSPDAVWLVDDLACTRGPLFSPRVWRDVFKPLYRRLGEFLHRNNISFWLHCCGDCRDFLRDFIECGISVLHPLQAEAGMDVRELKPRFGRELTFWGNISVVKMAGDARQCEAEVREKLTCAKEGGGYLYHSDHSVPPEVSFHRYQWIMELLEKYGRY
jgi:uroporphyrinogen decarboxylase